MNKKELSDLYDQSQKNFLELEDLEGEKLENVVKNTFLNVNLSFLNF